MYEADPGMQGGEEQKRSSRGSTHQQEVRSHSVKGGERSYGEAKKARVQVEKDAQLLANRIALLKQEEMRTWKKIEETRKRAQEVFSLKKKNEDKINRKIESIKNTQAELRGAQYKVQSIRKNRETEKRKINEAILLNKREEARLGKA